MFNETFLSLTADALQRDEYERCTFKSCDFANGQLTGCKFIDCTFVGCSLSLANVSGVVMNNAMFQDCKMLGVRFETCNPLTFSVSFEGCQLNDSSFFKMKMKGTKFSRSKLLHVDFSQADLTSANFANCDLTDATFDNTILSKADFRTSTGYIIDPDRNSVKKAKFSIDGVAGLLTKYDIEIS